MKKIKAKRDDLRAEYKKSDLGKLERGKYFKHVTSKSNVIILDPDMAEVFPDSDAVNKALHSLVDIARKASGLKRRSNGGGKQQRGG